MHYDLETKLYTHCYCINSFIHIHCIYIHRYIVEAWTSFGPSGQLNGAKELRAIDVQDNKVNFTVHSPYLHFESNIRKSVRDNINV